MKFKSPALFRCISLINVLVLSLAAAYSYAADARMTDDQFFNTALNASYTGCGWSTVMGARPSSPDTDYLPAKRALLSYLRQRTGINVMPVVPVDNSAKVPALLDHEFTFFGVTADLDEPDASTNIVWATPPDAPSNWLVPLVRFDFLDTVTSTWLYDTLYGTPNWASMQNMLGVIDDYLADIASQTDGVEFGGGLQTAGRIQAWTRNFFHFMNGPVNAGTSEFDALAIQLTEHLKHICQMADFTANPSHFFGIDNNRGMEQAMALQQVSISFPEFGHAGQWLARYQQWAPLYLKANIYANGSIGEPTTHYHRGQIQDVVTALDFGNANGLADPASDTRLMLHRMMTYYGDYVLPTRQQPMIGDASASAQTEAIHPIAVAYDRPDIRYITTIANPPEIEALVPSHTSAIYWHGAAMMRTGWEKSDRFAFLENQPPGSHSHPDDLSVSFYGYGDQLLLNSGRYSNDPDDEHEMLSNWHKFETEANSTVQIDSRPTRSFGHRINQWVTQRGFDFWDAEYKDAQPVILAAVDDAYIDLVDPDKPLGRTGDLKVARGGGLNRMIYIKFRPGVIKDAINNAKITLKVTNSPSGPGATQLRVYGLKQSAVTGFPQDWTEWNESIITWNKFSRNHSVTDAIIGGSTSDYVSLGVFDVMPSTTSIDFSTTGLKDFIASQTTDQDVVTIVIVDNQAQARPLTFASRNGADGPMLTLNIDTSTHTNVLRDDVVTHRRKVFFDRSDLMIVSDLLTSSSSYQPKRFFEQNWGLNTNTTGSTPTINTDILKGRVTYTKAGEAALGLQVQLAPVEFGDSASIARNFGWLTKNNVTVTDAYGNVGEKTERFTFTKTSRPGIPTTFDTVILANDGGTYPPLSTSRVAVTDSSSNPVSAHEATSIEMQIGTTPDSVYYYLSHVAPQSRRFAGFTSDAELVAIRKSSSGTIKTVSAKAVTLLDNEGGTQPDVYLYSAEKICDLEIDYSTGDTLNLYSSQPLQQLISFYWGATNPDRKVYFNNEEVTYSVGANGIHTIGRKLLLKSDFESGNEGWTANAWAVESRVGHGVMAHAKGGAPNADLVRPPGSSSAYSSWLDYVAETTLVVDEPTASGDAIGLLMRHDGTSNAYYGFVYDNVNFKLKIVKKLPSDDETVLGIPKTMVLPPATPHSFKGKLTTLTSGTKLEFYLNGVLQSDLTVTDTGTPLGAGRIALIARGASATFDDVFVTAETSSAATPVSPSGVLVKTLLSSANGYIGDHRPNTNLFDHTNAADNNAMLPVCNAAGDAKANRISYVQFDVSEFRAKHGSSGLSEAKLRLYGQAVDYDADPTPPAGVPVTLVGLFGPGSAWNDRRLTWNASPNHATTGSEIAGAVGSYYTMSSNSVLAPGWYEWDVTTFVNSHLSDADGKITFMLIDITSNSNVGRLVEFFSNVYVHKPELVVKRN